MRCFVGIDQADRSHRVHIMNPDGRKIKELSISNDFDGFEKLMKSLNGFDEILAGLETGHGHLVDFLREKAVTIFSLNPLMIKRYKQTQAVSGNKSDSLDAWAIADYIRVNLNHLKPLIFNSPEVERLKLLCISFDRIKEESSRQLNRLIYILKQYFPLYLELFCDYRRPLMLNMLMQWPKWNDLKNANEKDLVDFLHEHHYRNRVNVEKMLVKIRKYQQAISEETEFSQSIEAVMLADILLTLQKTKNRLEQEMKSIVNAHTDGINFLSVPGCGVILASAILAVMGDRKDRFHTPGDLRAYLGTAPVNYQSGNYLRVRMRKACNHKGRNAFYLLAFTSLQYCPWAREFYDLLRTKGKWNAAAIRTLSNKWVAVIFRIWIDGKPYDADRREKDFHKIGQVA